MADDRFQDDIVLLEPREQDASDFARNPIAFWKRSEAAAHGFESVRSTFQQNFDRLAEVFADGGLGLDRAVARRRARRARRESGCSANGVRTGVAEPPLRVVGGTAS